MPRKIVDICVGIISPITPYVYEVFKLFSRSNQTTPGPGPHPLSNLENVKNVEIDSILFMTLYLLLSR